MAIKKYGKLIYEINDLEMAMKKNINNSINLITNFMLKKVLHDLIIRFYNIIIYLIDQIFILKSIKPLFLYYSEYPHSNQFYLKLTALKPRYLVFRFGDFCFLFKNFNKILSLSDRKFFNYFGCYKTSIA